jgi:hypothetical protein
MNAIQSCRVAGLRRPAARSAKFGALVLIAAAVSAAPARAQQPRLDPRWQPWLGCWVPQLGGASATAADSADGRQVCVIPATGTSGIEIATLEGSEIVARDTVDASEARVPFTRQDCNGWQRVEFSAGGQRAYLESEMTCPGGLTRGTSGLMAISSTGDWLDVQGVEMGRQTGVHVVRYAPAKLSATLPDEIRSALQDHELAVGMARAAAAAPLTVADAVDASRHVDPAVAEAWLAEEGEGFALDAKRLVALADSGVPDRVIDVMVALSYPGVFSVNPASSRGEYSAVEENRRAPVAYPDTMYRGAYAYRHPWGYYSPWAWDYGWCSPLSYSCYSPYGWGYYSPFGYSPYGYGYNPWYGGYGWNYGGGTVVIVGGGGGGYVPNSHGRVIKGRGYTPGQNDQSSSSSARPRSRDSSGSSASARPSAPSSAQPAQRGSSSGSSSKSGSSGRTAKPRPR